MATRRELTKEVAQRYQKGSRCEKSAILNEVCETVGYNRHYASFLLRNHGRKVVLKDSSNGSPIVLVGEHHVKRKRMERPRKYGQEVLEPLRGMWEMMNYPCGKRLKPSLGSLIDKARQFKEIGISRVVEKKLRQVSPATIDRMLKKEREGAVLKCRAKTKPGTLLKRQIAIRMGGEWQEDAVGFAETDLVSHDGGCTRGDYGYTLTLTDIKCGWVEMEALPNRAQVWVFNAIQDCRERLPFDLKGIDSDNGGEFINHHLLAYCQQEGLVFTRSRPYRTNDNCHVEQKNFMAIRSYVGHSRYDRKEEIDLLRELYSSLRLYLNFFQPQMKLLSKERIGAKVTKTYDQPQTPYQRLISSDEIRDEQKEELKRIYNQLNPFELKRKIERTQNKLLKMVHEKRKGATVYVPNQSKPVLA